MEGFKRYINTVDIHTALGSLFGRQPNVSGAVQVIELFKTSGRGTRKHQSARVRKFHIANISYIQTQMLWKSEMTPKHNMY